MDIENEEIESTDFLNDDLVCSICYAEFLYQEDLVVHINQLHLHETSKSRYCKICAQIFPDIQEFALHFRNIHISNVKCCKYCTRLFNTAVEVREHEKRHKTAVLFPRISCSHCEQVFDNQNAVRNHELIEHGDSDDGYMLKDCLPALSSLLSMNANTFLAASYCNLPYICVVCDKTTLNINTYIQHLIDNKCSSLACDKCCNVFVSKNKLRIHIRKHLNEDKACKTDIGEKKCYKCKLNFKKLYLHLKSCTGMKCTLCDLTFDSVNEYSIHRAANHKMKSLSLEVCIYCQRQTVGMDAMEKHVERTHKNTKHLYKYHCTDCNRIFKHPKKLFAHFYSTHKDLHPYTCKICDQKFRIRKNFTLHIKITHKSVGFVEFDDNFHVFFTDKKSEKQSTCKGGGEKSVDNDSENDDQNCEYLDEDKCKTVIEPTNNDCNNDPKSAQTEKELNEYAIEIHTDLTDEKLTDENHKVVEGEDPTENQDNENLTKDSDEDCKIVVHPLERPINKSRKRKRNVTRKDKIQHANDDIDVLSDDSDLPLKSLCKKMKSQKNKVRKACTTPWNKSSKNKKFICDKCNRNCYTFQNYHRHLALHSTNETKVCMKCYEKFETVKELNEHIKSEHSTSKLTETLKKLLEKRKNADAKPKEIPNLISKEILDETTKPLSTTEKFRNTIKKVNVEKNTTRVTLKLVDKDKISVKKYLENFTPDNNEVKITMLKNTADNATVRKMRPFIKLTKFTPDPIMKSHEGTLKMPVKFTDDLNEEYQVSINLVADYEPPAMNFDSHIGSVGDNYINVYDNYNTYSFDNDADNKEIIPDVAQEVMLEGTEDRKSIVHSMNLKNLPAWHNVKVAHLAAEAPYFKISKINIDRDQSLTLIPEETDDTAPKDITLPNGKKLVSSNPFAHLLDTKTIADLKKTKKKHWYKPRLNNVAEAITKAMAKLDKNKGRPLREKRED